MKRSKYSKILPLFILISTLFMGIGYASLNSISLEIAGLLSVQMQEGLFVSSVEFSESKNENVEKLEVISSFQTIINSKVTLSNSDADSYVTYIVTIYNNTNDNYYYTGTTYDEEFYDNQDIIYTVDNLGSNIIKSNSVSIFNITFKYKDSILGSNSILNSYIKFNFSKVHLVTYENINLNNLPEYVFDNETLNVILDNISPSFKVYLDGTLITNYTFENNTLTILNVTGDIKIVGYVPTVNLSSDLIPVIYENNNWIVINNNSKWYDYDNGNWANAVILKNGVTKSVGEVVDLESDIRGIFVWIPRYEYKISTDNSNEIYVNFISKDLVNASNGYIIPDAFTFGTDEIDGIWFGKFETSMDSSNALYVIPNVKATLSQSVSTQFNLALNFANGLANIDSHMTKNSEWGAAAYLSQSIYGKFGNTNYSLANKEVYVNNSIGLYTGRSGGTTNPVDSQAGTYNYDDGFVEGSEESGIGASTTGNIYGIYDMSGGAFEYVMGYFEENTYEDSGFEYFPDLKYYDSYSNVTSIYYPYYSHALYETSGWYDDNAIDLNSVAAWYLRGGVADQKELAGIFAYQNATGGAGSYATFRISLVVVN